MKIKNILFGALLMVVAGTGMVFAGGIPQNSSLSGTVVADGLAQVGQQVAEGQALVKVKTITGASVAARANCTGKVTAVLVTAGSQVSAGQVVAEIAR